MGNGAKFAPWTDLEAIDVPRSQILRFEPILDMTSYIFKISEKVARQSRDFRFFAATYATYS
jgi:hypothetical protein